MKKLWMAVAVSTGVVAGALPGWAEGGLYGDPPDEHHAWAVHDMNRPQPTVVTPGIASTPEKAGTAPSDAIVLFDGQDPSKWESTGKDGAVLPCKWQVVDGALVAAKGAGDIRTKQGFGDCQLHVEWSEPTPPTGDSQGRGNSGVFLMSTYELQVLDCYKNATYPDGQTGSIYDQVPPLVNVCRPPGEWQCYDVVFHQPVWQDGKVVKPATVIAFQNGVLVQDHWILEGDTPHMHRGSYKQHADKLPLKLQDHGCPVRFRNMWIREIPTEDRDQTIGPNTAPEKVAATRKETAAKIRAEGMAAAANAEAPVPALRKLMESLQYEKDEAVVKKIEELAGAFLAQLKQLPANKVDERKGDVQGVLHDFKFLSEHQLLAPDFAPRTALTQFAKEHNLLQK